MRITIALILTCVLLLAGNAAAFTSSQYSTLELDLVCDNVIGVMPHVEIQTTPNTEVCIHWFNGDNEASVPNGDMGISHYCRTTDASGFTFFAYRARFSHYYPISDCGEGSIVWDSTGVDQEFIGCDLKLEILSINGNPDFSVIPVTL